MVSVGDRTWSRIEEIRAILEQMEPEKANCYLEEMRADGELETVLSWLSDFQLLQPLPSPLGAGDVVAGRYGLLEKLGEGGMGCVWRATQNIIGREVAVKVIHPILVTPAVQARFADEMEILGRLDHPGIVKIFDAGLHSREGFSIPFFAMELVDGVSLTDWATTRRGDRGALLRMLSEICAAVQHAHERKIVHRDLKPANILVGRDDRPVVLDFGIARLARGTEEKENWGFSGSFHYAAPEQHLCRDRDFRSGESVDIYAMGAILFEMLCGRRLYVFPSGTSLADQRQRIIEGHPPRLMDILPDCPQAIDEIATRAVQNDPTARYFSIASMGRALNRIARSFYGPPKSPPPPWLPETGLTVPGTNWKLTSKLGEGSTGQVWLAAHETLDEKRVFKFCDSEEKTRSLKRELTLFQLLKHRVGHNSHFISLHEVSLEEPPWYLLMDFVDAQDLETWCARQPQGLAGLPIDIRVEIVIQTAESLQMAHDAGILHRDLKPKNILIRTHSPLHVFIADFGIGHITQDLQQSETVRDSMNTAPLIDIQRATMSISGTMLYMAPEIIGKSPSSARSDIYSLGVLFWQLLIGDFQAGLDPIGWAEEIADPLLRDDLIACLARDPQRRWASAGALAASLRALPERRTAEARLQVELAAKERAAYRRGVMRTAAAATGIAATLFGAGWYAFDRSVAARHAQADARTKTLSAGLSELGRLALGNAADRQAAAQTLIQRVRPSTDDDRRATAAAYVPVLEREDWQMQKGPLRSPAIGAVMDSTSKFLFRHCADGTLEMADQTQADPIWSLAPAENPASVPMLAVAAEGRRVAVARGADIQIYNGLTGTPESHVTVASPVTALAWRPDGMQLAIGRATDDAEGIIDLCDGPNWNLGNSLVKNDTNPISRCPLALAYSPDGTHLAHWSEESLHLLIWRPQTGKVVAFARHPTPVRAVAWADGPGPAGARQTIYAAAGDAFLYRWEFELKNGVEAIAFDQSAARFPMRGIERQGHHCQWTHLALLDGEQYLAAADESGVVCCFNVATGLLVAETRGDSPILAFGATPQRVFLQKKDGQTGTLERIPSSVHRVYPLMKIGRVEDFDILPDGRVCACTGPGGALIFFDPAGHRASEIKNQRGHASTYGRGIRFFDDSHLVYSDRTFDCSLTLAGDLVQNGPPPDCGVFVRTEKSHERPALIALNSDRKFAVTARSQAIRWASVSDRSGFVHPCAEDAPPKSLAVSPRGDLVAWSDELGQAWLCAPHDPPVRAKTLSGHGITSVAFLGEAWCAAGSPGGTRLFNAATREEFVPPGLDLSQVQDLVAQENGGLAAAAWRDGGIALGWLEQRDSPHWHPLVILGTGEKGAFTRMRFVGRDRWLGAVARDGRLHLWDIHALARALAAATCLPERFPVPPRESLTP